MKIDSELVNRFFQHSTRFNFSQISRVNSLVDCKTWVGFVR